MFGDLFFYTEDRCICTLCPDKNGIDLHDESISNRIKLEQFYNTGLFHKSIERLRELLILKILVTEIVLLRLHLSISTVSQM